MSPSLKFQELLQGNQSEQQFQFLGRKPINKDNGEIVMYGPRHSLNN